VPIWLSALITLSLLVLLSGLAFSASYYVAPTGNDEDAGTQEKPWLTLQHAVDQVAPGDTILVESGTYAGCQMGRSGAADAPCTLKAAPGAKVIVDRPGDGNRRRSIIEVGTHREITSYWVVEGLEVMNAPRWGINLGRTDHVTVRNCVVHGCGLTGIFTSFSDHTLIESNESYGNHEHGIYHSNSGDYPILRGNRSHHNDGCGIHMNGDLNMGGDGIISHAVVEDNVIWENGKPRGGSAINCDGVSDSIIRNNLCYENHASGISLYAIDAAEGSSRNLVCNNTVVVAKDGRWALNIPWWQRRPAPVGNRAVNNILLSLNPDTGAIVIWGKEALAESDHNVVTDRFALDGVIAKEMAMPRGEDDHSPEGGRSPRPLRDWRKHGYDAHSRIAASHALFVDPAHGDYHLHSGSPAIGAGRQLPEVTADLEGRSRKGRKGWEAGCYLASPPGAGEAAGPRRK